MSESSRSEAETGRRGDQMANGGWREMERVEKVEKPRHQETKRYFDAQQRVIRNIESMWGVSGAADTLSSGLLVTIRLGTSTYTIPREDSWDGLISRLWRGLKTGFHRIPWWS